VFGASRQEAEGVHAERRAGLTDPEAQFALGLRYLLDGIAADLKKP
jgi:hypothetical protein